MRARWLVTAPLLLAVLAASTPAAHADEPAVVIDPATDLVDAQRVSLTGTGFPAGQFVAVVQCPTGETSPGACGNFNFADGPVASDGAFTFDVFVDAVLFAPQGEVDCRIADACMLVVDPPDFGTSGLSIEVPLHFDPDAPLAPPPSASVDPNGGLVDGQVVTVTGSGFRPNENVELLQCAPGAEAFSGCQFSNRFPITDDQGSFTAAMTLFATVPSPDGQVDCRTIAEPCVVVAAQGGFTAPRSARVTLQFDPDAPLLPPPTIDVSPATDVEDGSTVTVRGNGFLPDSPVSIALCAAGAAEDRCDDSGSSYTNADAAGAFEASLFVAADFARFDGSSTNCRRPPGCEVVARDFSRGQDARAPITFGPAPPSRGRYLDPVFDDVEVTNDVVYREAVDYQGNTVQLHLDVYQPKGDTETKRPVIIWMHGGYFIFGDKSSMAGYAQEFARRGYVAISLQYRLRGGIPITDIPGIVAAAYDAYDDATAAVDWLRSHAEDYGIDPDAIAAGGYSAGAVTSLNLAYLPGDHGTATASSIGAAVSIAGVSFGAPQAGDPPAIVFHGTEDTIVPFVGGESSCLNAQAVGVFCELVRYDGADHGIVSQFQRDIVRRTADFLAQHLLGLGATPPAQPEEPSIPQPAPPPGAPPPAALPAPVVVASPRFAA